MEGCNPAGDTLNNRSHYAASRCQDKKNGYGENLIRNTHMYCLGLPLYVASLGGSVSLQKLA